MTQKQKEFILEYFFKNDNYPGWRSIAEKLLEKGYCIVAGTDSIWKGEIGNFIKTNEEENAFGCFRYTFNKELLFSSAWFNEIREAYVSDLTKKMLETERERYEISQI